MENKYGPKVGPDNAKTWEKRKTPTGAKQLCPFVNEPLKDCFCREMNTQKNILAAINNCLGNYKECQIYVSRTNKNMKNLHQQNCVNKK